MKQISKIKGYEQMKEIYYVDSDGKVYSRADRHNGVSANLKELRQYEKTGGYLYVALMTKDNRTKYIRVNRLVAGAFVENAFNKVYVHHKDEDRKNNNAENLEWVTPQENNDYSLSKVIYCYDTNGDLVDTFISTREAARALSCNQGHLAAVARGRERSHRGYIFSYSRLTKQEIEERLTRPFYR